jgi:hypothetical protein
MGGSAWWRPPVSFLAVLLTELPHPWRFAFHFFRYNGKFLARLCALVVFAVSFQILYGKGAENS